ncbi:MAG: hypothetical protein P8N76_10835 [Pirellulaceae bacterium]|nr:hypothetical protein [Pirellulaceae bacterium]
MKTNNLPELPRLSIYHLMLWVFCTAAYLVMVQFLHELRPPTSPAFAELRRPTEIIAALIAGTCIAGVITLAQSWWLGRNPAISAAGHWLMIIEVFHLLVYNPIFATGIHVLHTSIHQLLLGTLCFIPTAMAARAAYHIPTIRWKLPFLLYILEWAGMGINFLMISWGLMPLWLGFGFFLQLIPLLLMLSVALAASYDLIAGEKRDWLHWTGVTTILAEVIQIVLWRIAI